MKNSSLFTLNSKDLIKGFIVAIFGAVFGIIQGSIDAGTFEFDWTKIWHAALAAAVAYIIKNFLTSNSDSFLGKDKPTS